jgi:hypothetical protein
MVIQHSKICEILSGNEAQLEDDKKAVPQHTYGEVGGEYV